MFAFCIMESEGGVWNSRWQNCRGALACSFTPTQERGGLSQSTGLAVFADNSNAVLQLLVFR